MQHFIKRARLICSPAEQEVERGQKSQTEAMTAPSPCGALTQEVTPRRGAAISCYCRVGNPGQHHLYVFRER